MLGNTNAQKGQGNLLGDKVLMKLYLTIDNQISTLLNGITILIKDLTDSKEYEFVYLNDYIEFALPIGNSFTIQCPTIRKCNAPFDYSGIASTFSDEIKLNYQTISPGVYIYSTDERFYTASNYSGSNDNVIGIAIITDTRNAVYSVDFSYDAHNDDGISNGTTSTGFNYCALSQSDAQKKAPSDFIGNMNYANNNKLDNYPQFSYCKSYIFKNGIQGKLPPGGYVQLMIDNATEFSNALLKLGKVDVMDKNNNFTIPTSSMYRLKTSSYYYFYLMFCDVYSKYWSNYSTNVPITIPFYEY